MQSVVLYIYGCVWMHYWPWAVLWRRVVIRLYGVAHNCDEVQLNEISCVLIMLENNIMQHAKLFYSAESKDKVCLISNKLLYTNSYIAG